MQHPEAYESVCEYLQEHPNLAKTTLPEVKKEVGAEFNRSIRTDYE